MYEDQKHESTTQKHMKNISYTDSVRRILLKTNLQWAKNTMWKKWRWKWWVSQITITILIWGLFIKLHKIKNLSAHSIDNFNAIRRTIDALRYIPGGPKKRPELSHGVMQQSTWNEWAEKHVYNEQTSSNMSMNVYLRRFHISRDTSKIVLHVIKMFASILSPQKSVFEEVDG